jgi:cell cycle checkpoint protein
MGRVAPKKKKATVVLSSDDEAEVSPTKVAASPVKTRFNAGVKKTTQRATQTTIGTPQSSKSNRSRKNIAGSPASQASPSPSSQKPKAKERTLFSFFNAQTQRQQSTPSSNGHIKKEESLKIEEDEFDLIEDDDSFDEALAALDETKFGSKYPVPLRQKRRINDVEGNEPSSMPKGSQLFKRAATETTRSVPPVDNRPWTERFGPVNFDELAVHKKKVQDVKSWLQSVTTGRERKRLLILKGAAGAGKTITVDLVSEALGIEVCEWRTSGITSSEEGLVSMSAQFQDFVTRTGTFGALDFTSNDALSIQLPKPPQDVDRRQLILIEEFPNTFSRTSSGLQSFRSAVQQYLEASTPSMNSLFAAQAPPSKPIVPIVMIISESLLSTSTASSDSFTAYRLLGPEILSHAGTTVIEFNPIAPTYMTKALDVVLQKESKKSGRRRAPGPAVLKHLAGLGDIRSAISSLEFLCLRGDDSGDWSGRVTFTKKKIGQDAPMSVMEAESLQMVTQRESTLGIFHAVGKVVYNKRESPAATDTPPPQPPTHLPQHARPKVSEVNTETLLNELGTDISTFVAALHENYILSCGGLDSEETLEHVNGCIDALSDADILSPDRFGSNQFRQTYAGTGTDSLRQDEISFQASVRGLLFSLPHPVKRITPTQSNAASKNGTSFGGKGAAFQMFYPASQRLWRRREETEQALDTVMSKLWNRVSASKASKDSSTGASNTSAVEAWRMNRFSGQAAHAPQNDTSEKDEGRDEEADTTTLGIRSYMAKGEMLVERLPYMATMRRLNKLHDLSELGKELDKVTRMSGSGIAATTNGDDDGEDADGPADGAEQWSTDRPTEEASTARKRLFGIRKESNKAEAVKDKMQSLVLEDDDIVDDVE